MLKNKRAILALFLCLSAPLKINATTSETCDKVCFPDKIYSQCTANNRSLSLEEKKLCDQMTADCQSCTEAKKTHATQSQKPCEKLCNTEQLINCHKQMETFSIEEQSTCSKLTADCQTCTEGKKTPKPKTEHLPCQGICDTEKLLECIKKFETLTTEQKAFCTKMNAVCQDCPKEN